MGKEDNSQDYDVRMKSETKGRRYTQEDLKKQHKREGSGPGIGKERRTNMGRRQSGIHGRKNIHPK